MTLTTTADNTIAVLLDEPHERRDKPWLQGCLQAAVQLELATIPPYLYAYWSVQDPAEELADTLMGIAWQEMLHMGLACNMLTAVGGTPQLTGVIGDRPVVPRYPAALPGGVRKGLTVHLKGVSPELKQKTDALWTFMEIEKPHEPLTPLAEGPTIGQFYADIRRFFPKIVKRDEELGGKQVTGRIGGDKLFAITTVKEAIAAIDLIAEQGEGTRQSPKGGKDPAEVAHYYRFGEHWHGKRLRQMPPSSTHKWDFKGDDLPRPAVHPLGEVPPNGWNSPPADLAPLLSRCNAHYRHLLVGLERAWSEHGEAGSFGDAVNEMVGLDNAVRELIKRQLPKSPTYGPEFLA